MTPTSTGTPGPTVVPYTDAAAAADAGGLPIAPVVGGVVGFAFVVGVAFFVVYEVRRQKTKALRRRAPKSLDPATVMTPKRSASSRPNPNEQINVSANPLGNAAVVASRSSRTMRAGSSSASLGGGGGSMTNMARAASWKPKGGF